MRSTAAAVIHGGGERSGGGGGGGGGAGSDGLVLTVYSEVAVSTGVSAVKPLGLATSAVVAASSWTLTTLCWTCRSLRSLACFLFHITSPILRLGAVRRLRLFNSIEFRLLSRETTFTITNNNKQAVREAATICPRPLQVDL